MNKPRLAAIDIGTNSLRLVVVEVDDDGSYHVLDEERSSVRLGYRLEQTGRLDGDTFAAALDAIGTMAAIAKGFEVAELRAIATSAVRQAVNGREFVREVRRLHGVRVDVISAEEEARLAFQSAARHFELDGRATAIVDIGGGSVEIVFAAGAVIDHLVSLELGAVWLTEGFVRSDPLKTRHWKRLRRAIDRKLEAGIGKPPFAVEAIIGSGGTFTSLAEMLHAERQSGGGAVQGYAVTRSEIGRLLRRLRDTPLETRLHLPGLNPKRADIIVAGVAVVARLARYLECRKIVVNDRGIRDGLILSMIAERFAGPAALGARRLDRMERLRAFARKCRSNERHAEQVSTIAAQIFDGLRDPFVLPAEANDLLAGAAWLHDVGVLIGHTGHHKHAYHLIMHGELPGFSAREVELIANVVRYSRRGRPKKSHPNFVRLPREDRRIVKVLAGILRVANGLDRTHTRRVMRVRVRVIDGRVRMGIVAHGDASVELLDTRQRTGLLERALGTNVEVVLPRLKLTDRRATG